MNGKSKKLTKGREFSGREQKFCTCHSAQPCVSYLSGECMEMTQHPYIHNCFMGGHNTAYIYVPVELRRHANAQIMQRRASYLTAGLRSHLYYLLRFVIYDFSCRVHGKQNLPGPETLPHTLCNATTITLSTSTWRTEPVLFNDGVSLSKQVTCLLTVEP